MPLLGAHMSIAGGFTTAIEQAAAHSCPAVQLFTKSPSQWAAKPITDEQATAFREAMVTHGIRVAVGHDSYLINLASPDPALRRRSIDAFADEVRRAAQLGLRYLVMHPGAHLGSGEESGLTLVARALDEVHDRCPPAVTVLLENTAGQGTYLGHRFEHLAAILAQVQDPARLGVCFDTCHAFAAGYGLSSAAEYRATMDELDRLVGLQRVKAFHVNDSAKARGSRVDRHAGLGRGKMGLEGFRLLMADERFADRPFLLETPKEEDGVADRDAVNLGILRDMEKRRAAG
jgi:deoxyribonuclease-4